MSENIAYEKENGILGGIIKTAALGGAGFAIYKGVTDHESMDRVLTKAINKIFPEKEKKLSIREQHTKILNEVLSQSNDERALRNKVLNYKYLTENTSQVAAHNMEFGKVSFPTISSENFTLADVKDIHGNAIGEDKIRNKVAKAFGINEKTISVEYEGTVAKFSSGGQELTAIPFSEIDKSSGSWKLRRGNAVYHSNLRAKHMIKGGAYAGIDIVGPNEYALDFLDNATMRTVMSADTKDQANVYRVLKARESGVIDKKIKKLAEQEAIKNLLEEKNIKRQLNHIYTESYFKGEAFMAPQNKIGMAYKSTTIKSDKVSEFMVNEILPGFSDSFVSQSTMKNLITGKGKKISPKALTERYSIGQRIRDKALALFVGGKDSAMYNGDDYMHSIIDLAHQGNLGFFGNPEGISENTLVAANTGSLQSAEMLKSSRGILWSRLSRDKKGGRIPKNMKGRTVPVNYNPNLHGPGRNLYGVDLAERMAIQNGGYMNITGSITPLISDTITFNTKELASMKGMAPISVSVDEVLTKADDATMDLTKVKVNWGDKGARKSKDLFFHEIFSDQDVVNNLDKNLSIDYKKGFLYGKSRRIAKMDTEAGIENIVGSDGFVLKKAKTAGTIEGGSLKEMIKANSMTRIINGENKEPGQIRIVANAIDDVVKVAVRGQQTRGAVTRMLSERGDFTHSNLTSPLNPVKGIRAEAYYAYDFYKNIFPGEFNGKPALGKESNALFEAILGNIHGHLTTYGQQGYNITVEGDAYNTISKYMRIGDRMAGQAKRGKNLTKLATVNKLGFINPHESNATASELEGMYGDLVSFWSSLRKGVIDSNGEKNIKIGNLTGSANELTEDWRLLGLINSDPKKLQGSDKDFVERFWNKSLTEKELKRINFSSTMAIAPQEISSLAQGTGYNDLKIPMRDMWLYENRPELVKELFKDSRNESQKVTEETLMMISSALGEDVTPARKLLEAKYGPIPTYTKENVEEIMGGFGNESLQNILDDPNAIKKSFLTKDVNPGGYFLKGETHDIYFASSDVTGGATWLQRDERFGVSSFAHKAHEAMRELYKTGKVSSETSLNIANMAMEQWHDSHGELATRAQLLVDRARYSKVQYDVVGINDETMYKRFNSGSLKGQVPEHLLSQVDEVNNFLGNSVQMGEDAFTQDFMNVMNEKKLIAQEKGISLQEALGEDHHLNRYSNGLSTDSTSNEIRDAAQDYLDVQKDLTRKRNAALSELTELSTKGTLNGKETALFEKHLNTIKGIYNSDHIGLALVGRDPNIYPMSVSEGHAFVGPSLNEKDVSIGKILLTNLNADADGDGIKVKMLYSAGARREFIKTVKADQIEIAKALDRIKVFGKTVDPTTSFQILTGNNRLKAFEAMADEHAVATAFAAFNTKAMTGSMHMAARAIKEKQSKIIGNIEAGEEEIRKAMNVMTAIVSRTTEQDVISSKHILRIIDENMNKAASKGTAVETIIDLLGGMTAADYKEVIKQSEGRVNPLLLFPLWDKKSRSEIGEDFASMVEDYHDLTLGMQSKSKERLAQIGKELRDLDGADLTKFVDKYSDPTLDWLMKDEGLQKVWPKMNSFAGDIMAPAFREGKSGRSTFVSESLNAAMNEARTTLSLAKGIKEEALDATEVAREANKLFKQRIIAGIGEEAFGGKIAKALSEKPVRSLIGMSKIHDAFNWSLKPQNLKRIGWAAAGGTLAIAALNTVFGDGSPENPNDLPSVNNPSFESNGYGSGGNVAISGQPGYNSSVSLLTDNTVPFNSALSRVSGLLGGASNTVAIRHDGSDPYKLDMMMNRGS